MINLHQQLEELAQAGLTNWSWLAARCRCESVRKERIKRVSDSKRLEEE